MKILFVGGALDGHIIKTSRQHKAYEVIHQRALIAGGMETFSYSIQPKETGEKIRKAIPEKKI